MAILALLAVAAATVAGIAVMRAWATRRTARVVATPADQLWNALGHAPDGRPAVLTFSTPSCAECRVQERIAGPLATGGVRLISVDAAAEPEVAGVFGVLSVPASVVFAGDGRAIAVNHGLAQRADLERQLARAS